VGDNHPRSRRTFWAAALARLGLSQQVFRFGRPGWRLRSRHHPRHRHPIRWCCQRPAPWREGWHPVGQPLILADALGADSAAA